MRSRRPRPTRSERSPSARPRSRHGRTVRTPGRTTGEQNIAGRGGFVFAARGYPDSVRDAYQDKLDQLATSLASACELVADALDKATQALLHADLQLAEQVISDDARIDDFRAAAEEQVFALLALQAPVATDLRIVLSGLHAAMAIERMGDLAEHIATTARRRHPHPVLPADVAPYVAEMGRIGSSLARGAAEVIQTRDLTR